MVCDNFELMPWQYMMIFLISTCNNHNVTKHKYTQILTGKVYVCVLRDVIKSKNNNYFFSAKREKF